MAAAALVLAAYLLGSIPSSYIVGRLAKGGGIDLREFGSGNLGATNLYRAVGWRYASIAVVFDISKGFVPTWFFPRVDGMRPTEWALAYGVAAILGHVFSIWVKLRGGKGVATGAGVYLALAPAAVAVSFAIWLAIVFATRIVAVASLFAVSLLPVVIYFSGHRFDFVFWSSLPLAALVWLTHRANLRRLLAGEELRARHDGDVATPGAGSAGEEA